MRYTFEAFREDGSPRRYVGMFKAPYDPSEVEREMMAKGAWRLGADLFTYWQRGNLDRPIYEDDDPRPRRGQSGYLPRELTSDAGASVRILEHLGIVWERDHWCAGSGTRRAVCGCG